MRRLSAPLQVVEELQIKGQRCRISAEHTALHEKYLELRSEYLQRDKRTVSCAIAWNTCHGIPAFQR